MNHCAKVASITPSNGAYAVQAPKVDNGVRFNAMLLGQIPYAYYIQPRNLPNFHMHQYIMHHAHPTLCKTFPKVIFPCPIGTILS